MEMSLYADVMAPTGILLAPNWLFPWVSPRRGYSQPIFLAYMCKLAPICLATYFYMSLATI
jgi:hypothetical protein